MNRKPKVLVVCTGNSMRSQMAEGLLRADLGDRIEVFSAGTHPSFVHPAVIAALHEVGIDISQHRSKSVQEFMDERLDLVITLCDHAADRCPIFSHARKTIHQGYPDPTRPSASEDSYEFLTQMRDQMRLELRELVIKELNL
jgi:arsenate reductase (thioredoxin)